MSMTKEDQIRKHLREYSSFDFNRDKFALHSQRYSASEMIDFATQMVEKMSGQDLTEEKIHDQTQKTNTGS